MKKLLFIAILPAILIASESKDYDIIQRTINFIIFAGILYYLIANPIKNAYKARISSIANRLEAIQDKLRASKNSKDEAMKDVEKARVDATNYIQTAKREAEILAQKIESESQNEINNLKKSFEDQKKFEERKMVRVVTSEIVSEIFGSDALKMDQNDFVNLILKKVS